MNTFVLTGQYAHSPDPFEESPEVVVYIEDMLAVPNHFAYFEVAWIDQYMQFPVEAT